MRRKENSRKTVFEWIMIIVTASLRHWTAQPLPCFSAQHQALWKPRLRYFHQLKYELKFKNILLIKNALEDSLPNVCHFVSASIMLTLAYCVCQSGSIRHQVITAFNRVKFLCRIVVFFVPVGAMVHITKARQLIDQYQSILQNVSHVNLSQIAFCSTLHSQLVSEL